MYYKEYYKQTAFDGQGLLLITCQPPTCYAKSGLFTPFMMAPRNVARLSSIASYVNG
jgi:2,4-dienoyl-CoA reductase-like NADH-dependent reductase (Old Yellow Enzyme family)